MEQLIAIISNMEGFVKRTHFYTKSWLFAFKILLKKLFLYKDQIFVTTDLILNKNFLQILLKISVAKKKADVLAKEKNCWVYNMVQQMISENFLLNMRNSILKKIFLILIFWEILISDKNRDNGEFLSLFFPYFKSKASSQDFSSNELEVDFPSDLVIFN